MRKSRFSEDQRLRTNLKRGATLTIQLAQNPGQLSPAAPTSPEITTEFKLSSYFVNTIPSSLCS